MQCRVLHTRNSKEAISMLACLLTHPVTLGKSLPHSKLNLDFLFCQVILPPSATCQSVKTLEKSKSTITGSI